MARTSIEERLADLDRWAAPTFAGVAVPEVARRAGRRRSRRRAVVALGIVMLVAVPAVAIVMQARRGSDPIVGPTATPQVTASPGVPRRAIEVPGGLARGQRPWVQMVDRDRGWLTADCHNVPDPAQCRLVVAVTSDRGRTWRRLTVPEQVHSGEFGMRVTDASSMHLVAPDKGIWLTRDGGATFAHHTFDNPPIEAVLYVDGPYHMQCSNRMNWDSARDTGECKSKRLVKSGVGLAGYQPPWNGMDIRVTGTGPDGRIWMEHPGGLAVSADEGRTWTETYGQRTDAITIQFSPSGRYGYMRDDGLHWHLDGTDWRQVTLPPGMRFSNNMTALDDGRLVIGNVLGVGFLDGDSFEPIPGVLEAEPGEVLRDGTIVLRYVGPDRTVGVYLGVTSGAATEWVLLAS